MTDNDRYLNLNIYIYIYKPSGNQGATALVFSSLLEGLEVFGFSGLEFDCTKNLYMHYPAGANVRLVGECFIPTSYIKQSPTEKKDVQCHSTLDF